MVNRGVPQNLYLYFAEHTQDALHDLDLTTDHSASLHQGLKYIESDKNRFTSKEWLAQ